MPTDAVAGLCVRLRARVDLAMGSMRSVDIALNAEIGGGITIADLAHAAELVEAASEMARLIALDLNPGRLDTFVATGEYKRALATWTAAVARLGGTE